MKTTVSVTKEASLNIESLKKICRLGKYEIYKNSSATIIPISEFLSELEELEEEGTINLEYPIVPAEHLSSVEIRDLLRKVIQASIDVFDVSLSDSLHSAAAIHEDFAVYDIAGYEEEIKELLIDFLTRKLEGNVFKKGKPFFLKDFISYEGSERWKSSLLGILEETS